MEEPNVPQPGTPAAPVPGGQGKPTEEIKVSRAEYEALRRERDEARESEKFWAQRARSGGQQPPEPEPEPEEEIETSDLVPRVTGDADADAAIWRDPEKWQDSIAKGPESIERFIRANGYVTSAEAAEIAAKVARRTVEAERQKMTADNVLMREYPDLAKPDSALFKATAVELNKLVAMDPRARHSPATLYAAANTAAAKLEARRPQRGDHDTESVDRYERPEAEEDRRRRADAQDGSRSRGRDTIDDTDLIGPEAAEVMKQMGISRDEFLESARETRGMRPRGRR